MKFFSRSGFTVLEILVVVTIIGLLASVVLGATSQVRKRSRDNKKIAHTKTVREAIEFFQNDNGDYPSKNNVFSGLLTVIVPSNNASRAQTFRNALAPYIKDLDSVLPITQGPAVAWTYISVPPEYAELTGPEGTLCLQLFGGYYFSVPVEETDNSAAKTDGGKSDMLYEIIAGPYQLDPCSSGFGW